MKSSRTELENEWKKIFDTDLPRHVHKAYAERYIKWQNENKGFEKSLQKQIDKLVENYEKGISAFTPSTPLEIKPEQNSFGNSKESNMKLQNSTVVMNFRAKSTKVFLQSQMKLQEPVGMERNFLDW